MRNFLAVGDDAIEILFDVKYGITVIKGSNRDVNCDSSNGSGKSTIIEAVFFGLTGATLRKLNLEGIIHNKRLGECIVEIEFDDIKIIRSISAKRMSGGAKLFIKEIEQTTASVKETNKLIDQIVGINFETLSNILIFGQHNIVSFLDAGEKEKREIIESLMNLREYNEYEENARAKLKDAKNALKSLIEGLNIHTSHLNEQKQLLQKQQGVLDEYRRTLKTDIDILDQKIASVLDIEQLKRMWDMYAEYILVKKSLEEKIDRLVSEQNKNEGDYNAAIAKKQLDQQNKQPLIDKLNQIKAKFHIVEDRKRQLWQELVNPIEAQIAEKNLEIIKVNSEFTRELANIRPHDDWEMMIRNCKKSIQDQKHRIDDIKNKSINNKETCPTCYGEVNSENAHRLIVTIEIDILEFEKSLSKIECKKIEDLSRIEKEKLTINSQLDLRKIADQEEIAIFEKSLDEAKDSVKNQYFTAKQMLENLVLEVQLEVDNFDIDLNNLHNSNIELKKSIIMQIINDIACKNVEIKNLIPITEPKTGLDEMGKLQYQMDIDKKDKESKIALIKDNPYMGMIAAIEESTKKIEEEVAKSQEAVKLLESKMPYYEFWLSHMGSQGLKSYVVEQILPTLNIQVDFWMQIMYSGTLSLKFDKYFNASITNNATNREVFFGQCSGGERRRIEIALMLSFRQILQLSNGKKPNVLYFDEVAEHLDEPGIYSLYSAMQELSKDSHVYVITHNPILLQLLENCPKIHVQKIDGASKIVL